MMSSARIGVFLAAALSAWTARAESIIWMLGTLPPMTMTEGPLAGQGAGQIVFAALSKNLSDFEWRVETASSLRVLHEMQTRDGICSFSFAKLPEREGKMLFSRRAMTVPGSGVILREDRLADFQRVLDPAGAVDLSLLGAAHDLTGGYVMGRPHFGTLKDYIADPRHKASLVADDPVKLFRQVAARHLDFLFALRDETNYFAEILGSAKLISLPIAGTEKYGTAYVSCSTGPVGQRAMQAIDAWLADDRHWVEFVAPWERWLSPADYAEALIPR
jgi:uncharacterized protein (TIGR02285 family)